MKSIKRWAHPQSTASDLLYTRGGPARNRNYECIQCWMRPDPSTPLHIPVTGVTPIVWLVLQTILKWVNMTTECIQQFIILFPEHLSNDFYAAGESYGEV